MQTSVPIQRTRREILDYLNRHGPATVDDLTRATGVVPVTVRAHLGVLERDGLVTGAGVRSGRAGRPRIYYSLTTRAREVFPKSYDQLALRVIGTIAGPAAQKAVFHQAGSAWAERLRREIEGLDPDQRIEMGVRALTASGCEAEWVPEQGSLVVRLHNCPYSNVVQQFPDLCEMERTFLAEILDLPVRIEESGPGCTQCTLVAEPPAQR